jgi:hypothetical protein
MVVGCESSAYALADLTKDQSSQGWSRLPADVVVCNFHAYQLKDPATEWMLERDARERKLYVGDGLRNLNEALASAPVVASQVQQNQHGPSRVS